MRPPKGLHPRLIITRLACRLRRRATHAFRYEPPNHQLYLVHYRVRWIRHVPEERLPSKAVWALRLGAHEFNAHCCLEVTCLLSKPFIRALTIAKPFHYQQHSRGAYLALGPCLSGHLQ